MLEARIGVVTSSNKKKKDQTNDKVKCSILLTCIGPQDKNINNTFHFAVDKDWLNFDLNLEKSETFCIFRQNISSLSYSSLTYK